MILRRGLLRTVLLTALFPASFLQVTLLVARETQPETGDATTGKNEATKVPVLQSISTLVSLDVTVVDKAGRPVVTGLTRDDFSITEDKKPQRIFSFEAPEEHISPLAATASSTEEPSENKVPQTILVLDFLNSKFEEISYIRDEVHKFLEAQGEELKAPTELMLLSSNSMDLLQGYTRSRADLLFALDHIPTIWPYKSEYRENFLADLIRQSYIALQQISIQSRGMPGRKNVIWLGRGAPDIDMSRVPDPLAAPVLEYQHHTVNMMVEARISLFLIHPGFIVHSNGQSTSKRAGSDQAAAGKYDPFAKGNDKSFAGFVSDTGGKIFDQNDVAAEIEDSLQLGSQYYTLTYQPHDKRADGRFRHVHVTLRNPDLRVVTKAGFFAPEKNESVRADDRTVERLTEAAMATVPLPALNLKVSSILRHPDAHTVEISVQVNDKKLDWQAIDNGNSSTTVIVIAASRSARADILASRVAKFYLRAGSQDLKKLADVKPEVTVTLPIPRTTKNVRLALATADGGRIGTVDLERATIDAAPESATPQPQLKSPKSKETAEKNTE